MTLHHQRLPHHGNGIGAGLAVMDTYLSTPEGHSGRIVAVMADGPDHLLVTLDDALPAKCPRCGHDTPDPSRKRDGDHLVIVEGPLSVDRAGVDQHQNYVTYRATQPYLMVWCSEFDQTIRALRPEFERQR